VSDNLYLVYEIHSKWIEDTFHGVYDEEHKMDAVERFKAQIVSEGCPVKKEHVGRVSKADGTQTIAIVWRGGGGQTFETKFVLAPYTLNTPVC